MDIGTQVAPAPDNQAGRRIAGSILIATSLLCVLAIAHHPSLANHEIGKVAAEIADKAWIDRVVHGSLIVLLAAQLFAYVEFCSHIGFTRGAVRAGMIGYAIGVGAMMGAALIDGFVISDLGTLYAPGRPEALDSMRHLLNLCGISVRALASLGAVAMSVGFAWWSVALLRASRVNIWMGASGLLLGGAPAIAVLFGVIELNLHGAIIVVLCQTVWNVVAGIELVRAKF